MVSTASRGWSVSSSSPARKTSARATYWSSTPVSRSAALRRRGIAWSLSPAQYSRYPRAYVAYGVHRSSSRAGGLEQPAEPEAPLADAGRGPVAVQPEGQLQAGGHVGPPVDGGAEERPDRAEHVGDLVGVPARRGPRVRREDLAHDLPQPREHLGLLTLLGEQLTCVPVQLVVLAPAPALGRAVDAEQAVRRQLAEDADHPRTRHPLAGEHGRGQRAAPRCRPAPRTAGRPRPPRPTAGRSCCSPPHAPGRRCRAGGRRAGRRGRPRRRSSAGPRPARSPAGCRRSAAAVRRAPPGRRARPTRRPRRRGRRAGPGRDRSRSSSSPGIDHGSNRSTASAWRPRGIAAGGDQGQLWAPGDELAGEGGRAVEGRLATVEDEDERTVRRQLGHHGRDRVVARRQPQRQCHRGRHQGVLGDRLQRHPPDGAALRRESPCTTSATTRDFPTPAGPATVTRPGPARCAATAATSAARPTKLVVARGTGAARERRLVAERMEVDLDRLAGGVDARAPRPAGCGRPRRRGRRPPGRLPRPAPRPAPGAPARREERPPPTLGGGHRLADGRPRRRRTRRSSSRARRTSPSTRSRCTWSHSASSSGRTSAPRQSPSGASRSRAARGRPARISSWARSRRSVASVTSTVTPGASRYPPGTVATSAWSSRPTVRSTDRSPPITPRSATGQVAGGRPSQTSSASRAPDCVPPSSARAASTAWARRPPSRLPATTPSGPVTVGTPTTSTRTSTRTQPRVGRANAPSGAVDICAYHRVGWKDCLCSGGPSCASAPRP